MLERHSDIQSRSATFKKATCGLNKVIKLHAHGTILNVLRVLLRKQGMDNGRLALLNRVAKHRELVFFHHVLLLPWAASANQSLFWR